MLTLTVYSSTFGIEYVLDKTSGHFSYTFFLRNQCHTGEKLLGKASLSFCIILALQQFSSPDSISYQK